MAPRYAMIFGQGRSGTNWLLDLLDVSATTFCRNEPHGCAGSPLKQVFHHRGILRRDQAELESKWDGAAHWTATRMGQRDHRVDWHKSYVHPLARRTGLYRMVQGPKYRRLLRVFLPQLRGDEWRVPSWISSEASLASARAVFKMNQAPGWAAFALRHRPDVPVFHIVRHPGGFLNSWANRYLAQNDPAVVLRENRERLHEVIREDAAWGDRMPDVDRMSVEASELWYWRYANETIAREGEGRPQYRLLTFEGLAENPVGTMRGLYELAELPWNAEVERTIRMKCERSQAISSDWRKKLDPEQVALCEEALARSPLGRLWD